MIDYSDVSQWLKDYVAAWKSYDRAAIGALFAENAAYRYSPYDEPLRGRDAIVESWLEDRDPADTYEADYKPLVVDGNTAVARGRTYYYEDGSDAPTREFDNIFVLEFDDDGRVADFCEWYMEPHGQ